MSEEFALAAQFDTEYAALKGKKGEKLTLTSIRLIVENLTPRSDASLYDKILKIAVKLHHLRDEFAHIDADKISDEYLNQANMRLEAVIKATEKATETILDSAQKIQNQAEHASAEAKAAIIDEVTKIFEACNFQDLTGQHINKVLKTLIEIEDLVRSLIKLLPAEFKEVAKKEAANKNDDSHLLNGPNYGNDAPSQDDIDKIFAEC